MNSSRKNNDVSQHSAQLVLCTKQYRTQIMAIKGLSNNQAIKWTQLCALYLIRTDLCKCYEVKKTSSIAKKSLALEPGYLLPRISCSCTCQFLNEQWAVFLLGTIHLFRSTLHSSGTAESSFIVHHLQCPLGASSEWNNMYPMSLLQTNTPHTI